MIREKIILILLLIVTTLCHVQSLEAVDTHMHGIATARLVIDESKGKLTLRLPADSVLGFEHKAVTTAEKQRLATVMETLKTTTILRFYGKKTLFKKATELPVTVSKPIIVYQGHSNNDERHEDEHSDHHHDDDTHEDEHKHSEPEAKGSGHYDIILTQDLEFPKDKNIRQLQTSLFKLFPDTHSFDIEIVSESKQFRYSLTQKKDKLSLKGY